MTTSKINNLPKGTVELEISIPWESIKDTYEKLFIKVGETIEVPGFRKGKAPKKLLEEKIDKTKLYEEVVKNIVPKAYQEAIKEHNLKPITSPKVDVLEAKEGQIWKIKATLALKPTINLKNYKEKIKELKKEKSGSKIWVPGKEGEKKPEEAKKPTVDDIVSVLVNEVGIELSDMLIEEEANRLLAGLVDQTQKLGMTVEQYLAAKGKTTESLRAEYAKEAIKNLTIELSLAEIADKENITVTQSDIDKLIEKVEKPEEKERLKSQSYYLAHLIRQQKTLDFLYSL